MTTLHLEIPVAEEVIEKMGLPALEEFFRKQAEILETTLQRKETAKPYGHLKKYVGTAPFPDAVTDKYDAYDQ